MNMPFKALHIVDIVGEHENAAGTIHDVVIQIARKAFPNFQGVFIKSSTFIEKVIRSNDGRISPSVSAAEPSSIEDGHVRYSMVLCKVICRRKTVTTRTHNDYIIFRLRFRHAPLSLPSLVIS